MGQSTPAWAGAPADTSWHTARLELRAQTYVLWVDDVERGRGVSYWRPYSLYLGSPVVLPSGGRWTEVGIRDVLLEACTNDLPTATPTPTRSPTPTARLALPLVCKGLGLRR